MVLLLLRPEEVAEVGLLRPEVPGLAEAEVVQEDQVAAEVKFGHTGLLRADEPPQK